MIYVVRHGKTDWNVAGRIQGQTETYLTNEGVQQARDLQKELAHIQFDVAFCSPLARAKDTCKIILDGKDMVIKFENCLMERDFGEMVGKVDNFMSFWNLKKPRTAKGLESITDMEKRIFPFLKKLVVDYNGKNVLIVAHQGPLFIIENFFGYAPKDGDYLPLRLRGCGYRTYNDATGERKEYGTDETGL